MSEDQVKQLEEAWYIWLSLNFKETLQTIGMDERAELVNALVNFCRIFNVQVDPNNIGECSLAKTLIEEKGMYNEINMHGIDDHYTDDPSS